MKETQLLELTPELAEKLSANSIKHGGFQRNLNHKRVKEISESVGKNGSQVPPILVANTEKGLLVIDGQHRLEAWKNKKYQLGVVMFGKMKESDVVDTFVDVNSKQVRVSLNHILNVDQSVNGRLVRKIADEYGINNRQSYYALVGSSPNVGGRSYGEQAFSDETRRTAELVLARMTADERWKDNEQCFNRPGAIKSICAIVRKSKSKDSTVKRLLSMDFTQSGPLFFAIKLSGNDQANTKNLMLNFLMK